MVALFLTTLLATLGLGMMYFLDQDARFNLELQRAQQAQALAESGILYARYQILAAGGGAGCLNPPITSFNPLSPPSSAYWTDSNQVAGFYLWKEPSQYVHSVGVIRDSQGKILVRRELAADSTYPPLMNLNAWDVDL